MRLGLFHRLLAVNLGLALAVLLVATSVFALSARRVLVEGLGQEAMQLAVEIASGIDGTEILPVLAEPPDLERWREWVRRLLTIQNALGASGVENVYLLAPREGALYVAADPTGDDIPFGVRDTVYIKLKLGALADGEAAFTPDAYADEWGTWVSGFAPVLGSAGEAVALVGVDLPLGAFPLMRAIVARELVLSALPAALLALVASLIVSGRMARPVRALTAGLRRVRSGDYALELEVRGGGEFGEMAEAFNELAHGLAEREHMRAAFAESVSPEVAEKMLSGSVKSGGEVREATVLFADIRGFTALSETLSARGIIEILNECFDCLLPCISARGGTVDKLIGDEVMAVFGAPNDLDDDAGAAVLAALDMQEALRTVNDERQQSGAAPLALGIGISSGALVAGAVGSRTRRNYTVLGNVVNLGSRLCDHASPGQILVSQATYLRVKHAFDVRALQPLTPKGITFPIHAFEVLGPKEPAG